MCVYSLDNVTVVKSIFQIFMDEPLQEVLPLLEQLMTDNDRHKQRAAAEVIGGESMGETLACRCLIDGISRSIARPQALATCKATDCSRLASQQMEQDFR